MRTFACPACPLCGAKGVRRYHGLRDRLFSAPGEWDLNQCPNEDCGILWLDPMPVEEDLGEAYREYFTHGKTARARLSRMKLAYFRTAYGYRPTAALGERIVDSLFFALYRLRFRRRVELDGQVHYLSNPAKPARLLDVGCGSGDAMRFMALLGWSVEGVEFDPQAIATARQHGLVVHPGSLREQNFPDDTFDAVVLSHVIEHLPRPVEVLAECRRILTAAGTLVMLTPNAASLGHRKYGADWMALDPPRHLHVFTPAALARATRQAGFGEVKVTSTIRNAENILLASRMIRHQGSADMDLRHGWLRRRWARLVQAAEALALQFDGNLGEEIVVVARKSPA